jgi:hypothetical protein
MLDDQIRRGWLNRDAKGARNQPTVCKLPRFPSARDHPAALLVEMTMTFFIAPFCFKGIMTLIVLMTPITFVVNEASSLDSRMSQSASKSASVVCGLACEMKAALLMRQSRLFEVRVAISAWA